jgi:menaquinone-specific isochorismate synthase
MQWLSIDHFGSADRDGLRRFLHYCQGESARLQHPILASITLPSDYLDPLAVLQTVNDPRQAHLFLECSSRREGLAGAEPILEVHASGEGRLLSIKDQCRAWGDHTIAAGDASLPWAGPHWLTRITFEEDSVNPEESLPAAWAMIPRWQVGWLGNRFSATANLLVAAGSNLDALVEPLWRAHKRFRSFEYGDVHNTGSQTEAPATGNTIRKPSTPDRFRDQVCRALDAIHQGKITKLVLSRSLTLQSEVPWDALSIVNLLRARFPECHAFSFQDGYGVSWIGASPERLISLKNNHFETEALAGSIARGGNARQDAQLTLQLLASSKDLDEHGMVLTYILSRLQGLGLNPTWEPKPEILQLSNVQHLRVSITGTAPDGTHLLDLASALHPTPALGGLPAETALPLIRTLEEAPRGTYGGLTGWFDSQGNGNLMVVIRCARVQGSVARLVAGAGIVNHSLPELEYQETGWKLDGMLPFFENAAK